MARITVEDCIEKIPNRFELVMLAAQRSRDLSLAGRARSDAAKGKKIDKNTVASLREIAEDMITENQDSKNPESAEAYLDEQPITEKELREKIIKRFQKVHRFDELDEEEAMDKIERSPGSAPHERPKVDPFLQVAKKDNFSAGLDSQFGTSKFEDVNPEELED